MEEDDGDFPFPFPLAAAVLRDSSGQSSSATPKTGMQTSAGGKSFQANGTGSFFFTGDVASFTPAFARDAPSPAPEAIALETRRCLLLRQRHLGAWV